ncbi:MAG: tetratricopeptide repeat protein [Rhizomicrobium sp.]
MVPLSVESLPQDPFIYASAALLVLFLWAWLAAARARRRARRQADELGHAKQEIEKRDLLLEKSRAINKDILARMPDKILKDAARDAKEGHFAAASRALNRWLNDEGPLVAPLLLERARWAFIRAHGEMRPYALAGAEAYAAAAQVLAPHDDAVDGFLGEIRALRKTEGRSAPALPQALDKLDTLTRDDAIAPDLFGTDLDLIAGEAEHNADKQYELGRNNLALTLIGEAITIRTQMAGADAVETLNALSLKGYILLGLNRAAEALPIIRSVAERLSSNPEYGPDHPDTLSCRYELAQVLDSIGKETEAMNTLRDVIARQGASPELGQNHPDTLESRRLLKTMEARMATA